MQRRDFLTAGGMVAASTLAGFSPERAHAATQMDTAARAGLRPDWSLATADFGAEFANRPMRRIRGRAPPALSGALYRNGPGQWRRPGGEAGHWFDGDGLLRAFRVDEGRATLSARFIDTPKRRADAAAGAVVTPGFGTLARPGARVGRPDDASAANINVIERGTELWALWEAGSPMAIDPASLATKGFKTLAPGLEGMPFLAHPRIEPGGRSWNLGQSGARAVIWRNSPDGALEASEMIDLGRASYMHDFTATDRHLIILLQPLVRERNALPFADAFAWKPELGSRVIVLDKDDLSRRRTFELPPFFFFHLGDAWSDAAGTLRFDACIDGGNEGVFGVGPGRDMLQGRFAGLRPARLALITLHTDGRAELSDAGAQAEFPRTDPRFAGAARRFTVHASGTSPARPLFQGLSVRDWRTERSRSFDFGPHQLIEEAVFVPRPGGSAEFDGWLLAPSLNLEARATELHVFDARRVDAGPICSWRADAALPVSLHGCFVQA
jgi:carotenoid cleavage dioxygenase-like enzyme